MMWLVALMVDAFALIWSMLAVTSLVAWLTCDCARCASREVVKKEERQVSLAEGHPQAQQQVELDELLVAVACVADYRCWLH